MRENDGRKLCVAAAMVLAGALLTLGSGCQGAKGTRNALLPPHPNSDYEKDVEVSLKVLSNEGMLQFLAGDFAALNQETRSDSGAFFTNGGAPLQPRLDACAKELDSAAAEFCAIQELEEQARRQTCAMALTQEASALNRMKVSDQLVKFLADTAISERDRANATGALAKIEERKIDEAIQKINAITGWQRRIDVDLLSAKHVESSLKDSPQFTEDNATRKELATKLGLDFMAARPALFATQSALATHAEAMRKMLDIGKGAAGCLQRLKKQVSEAVAPAIQELEQGHLAMAAAELKKTGDPEMRDYLDGLAQSKFQGTAFADSGRRDGALARMILSDTEREDFAAKLLKLQDMAFVLKQAMDYYDINTRNAMVAGKGYNSPASDGIARSAGLIASLAEPVAAMVLKLGIDFVQGQLEAEASMYTGEFQRRSAFCHFYKYLPLAEKLTIRTTNVGGFEMTRLTEGSWGSEKEAFKLVCAIKPLEENRIYALQPVYYKMSLAKAKVLAYRGWKFWCYPYLWAFGPSDRLNTSVSYKIQSIWIDKDDQSQVKAVANDTFTLDGVKLDGEAPWRSKLEARNIRSWFPAPPTSFRQPSSFDTGGVFWLNVTVTEKDPSHAEKYITDAVETIKKEREGWIKEGSEAVGNFMKKAQ